MPKDKTKRCPWDTVCTEMREGVWEWETAGMRWRWLNVAGTNTAILHNGDFILTSFHRKLEEAVCFSWGFHMGAENERLKQARRSQSGESAK